MMEMEQRRRRSILDEGCKNLNISRSHKHTSHLIVDDKYKLLFNFIPKVSCTTWNEVFRKLRMTHHGKNNFSKYTKEEKQYRLENYRKAVFFREPITRLLSAHLSKFCDRGQIQRFWENKYGQRLSGCTVKAIIMPATQVNMSAATAPFLNITLAEFIQYITDLVDGIRLHAISDHFLPQNLVAMPCAIHYDFIGHFENLTTEAPYMLKFLGVNHVVEYPPVHESAARDKLIEAYKKVPLDLINRLRKYYHADYELFGYSFDDTLQTIINGTFFDD